MQPRLDTLMLVRPETLFSAHRRARAKVVQAVPRFPVQGAIYPKGCPKT
jgi:hypothetical protein